MASARLCIVLSALLAAAGIAAPAQSQVTPERRTAPAPAPAQQSAPVIGLKNVPQSNCPSGGIPFAGLCWGGTQFLTYTAAATACGGAGGRLPTLGELVGFRYYASQTAWKTSGIECSSDFDAGTGTVWCVGDKGAISGTGLPNQAEGLSKVPAQYRCVFYQVQK